MTCSVGDFYRPDLAYLAWPGPVESLEENALQASFRGSECSDSEGSSGSSQLDVILDWKAEGTWLPESVGPDLGVVPRLIYQNRVRVVRPGYPHVLELRILFASCERSRQDIKQAVVYALTLMVAGLGRLPGCVDERELLLVEFPGAIAAHAGIPLERQRKDLRGWTCHLPVSPLRGMPGSLGARRRPDEGPLGVLRRSVAEAALDSHVVPWLTSA